MGRQVVDGRDLCVGGLPACYSLIVMGVIQTEPTWIASRWSKVGWIRLAIPTKKSLTSLYQMIVNT